MDAVAHVRVSRRAAADIKMRLVEVLVDDKFAGHLHFGEDLDLTVAPGRHKITVTNRLNSRTMEFEVDPGQTAEFRTSAVLMGGMWLFVSMMGTVAYRVTLERAA